MLWWYRPADYEMHTVQEIISVSFISQIYTKNIRHQAVRAAIFKWRV